MIVMPSVRNTSSKLEVNFVSLSRIRNFDPLPHWMGGDAGQVDHSGVELDEEQYVEASEQHRVDGEEVAGQHGRRLGLQEL
jgi:hypothetical protein